MDINNVESKAKKANGRFVLFAKNNMPTLSIFSIGTNNQLREMTFKENTPIYFDLGDFTYLIVKTQKTFNFSVKHNKVTHKNKKLTLKTTRISTQNKYLPLFIILFIIFCVLMILPAIAKLL